MPRRNDISKVLILGSGPIIIGQASEFDYSGTQACKVLREDGFEVVLVNSNPATIMTDPEFADSTYVEPITPEIVEKVIAKERPQVLLPTLGGQTGLNVAVDLAKSGVLDRYGVELIGAKLEAIEKAEDRELFKKAMENIGLEIPKSGFAYNLNDARGIAEKFGFPLIIRPSYTLGGHGGGVAFNSEEYLDLVARGLDASPIGEIMIEESVIGWKEYELEVMRDLSDNVVIICPIENFDPMGIHTGDSVTVAPAQTLTDKEYQRLRDASVAIIREIGVETGGSNIQFAVNPDDGRLVVIEMNPRVSRSSALASKATGFPIAKIAAKLAVGYRLDEIPNDITKETPACFEPAIDYVVTKIPRWAFEKFPQADDILTTQMKSVGEVMSIGRTFKESLQKAMRSLEKDVYAKSIESIEDLRQSISKPNPERLHYVMEGMRRGIPIDEIFELTAIDRWFLANIAEIVELEKELSNKNIDQMDREALYETKRFGFSDKQIAELTGSDELKIRDKRKSLGVIPTYKSVDTCAAEFEAYTPYFYSTYETEDEANPSDREKIVILGSGPNRIGQGIEFDYCCVHATFALKEAGYETILINCNPETVSTDYDTSDKLYFEPLTFEDVMNIVENEKPVGVVVQFGGQTPLKLSVPLEKAGVRILGTSSNSIDLAEDRKRFGKLLKSFGIKQPENGTATNLAEALRIAKKIGFPVMVRPSYVLGGRAMEIVYEEESLKDYISYAVAASHDHPVLIDKFLEDAIEIDVDAVCDGKDVYIGGVMEHIEEAGVHSGDSACVIPPHTLGEDQINEIIENTKTLALALKVKGLLNIQFAVKDNEIYVLEVNPRASRTVPFVSKATGVPLAKVASLVLIGKKLKELDLPSSGGPEHFSIKEAVLPFIKFPGVDAVLGPEMKSTGEVMGIDTSFGKAFAKAEAGASASLPEKGNVFLSVKNKDKRQIIFIAKKLKELGFGIYATRGTASVLKKNGIEAEEIRKVVEGRPNVVDLIKSGSIDLVINTPFGHGPRIDGYEIRGAAVTNGVPIITTIYGASAAVQGIEAQLKETVGVKSLQEYHRAGTRDEGRGTRDQ